MCDCTHNDNGLGALAAFYGLGLVQGLPVHRGALFSFAIEFADWTWASEWRNLPEVLSEIQTKLNNSGYVSGYTKVYQLTGYFNPFVVIEGYSGREYGSDLHLRDAIASVVQSVYPQIDYSTMQFEVETYNPQTNQVQTVRRDTSGGGATGAPPECKKNEKFNIETQECEKQNSIAEFFDELAASLGVTRSQAVMIGAGGAILGVVLLKRLI